jgi:hypothetical protein
LEEEKTMAVYVDELRPVLPASSGGWNYREACRLWADGPLELDAFAGKLGLRKDWKRGDHYVLTRNKRGEALRRGATLTSSRKFAQMRRRSPARV